MYEAYSYTAEKRGLSMNKTKRSWKPCKCGCREDCLKVSWTEMKSDIDMLNQIEEKRILLDIIKEKSGKMFGHLMRSPT